MDFGLSFLTLLAETRTGPLRWASLPPAWLLVLVILAGFFWIRTLYKWERGRAGPMPRLMLTLLRVGVLVLVLLLLGGPYREQTRTAPDPAHLVVLIDTSASMETEDSYDADEDRKLREGGWLAKDRPTDLKSAGISRGDLVKQYLTANDAELLRSWADRFVVHTFAFDGDWRSLSAPIKLSEEETPVRRGEEDVDPVGELSEKIEKLAFDGGRTRIGALLRNLASEFGRRQDRNLAGVLLISDGRDTSDGEAPLGALTMLGPVKEDLRITPVLVGNPSSGKNLWVERIRAKDEVLVGDEVLFESAVRQKGYPAETDLSDFSIPDLPVKMTVLQVEDENKNRIDPPRDVTDRVRRASRRTRIETQVDVPAKEDEPVDVRLRATFNDAGRYIIRIAAEPPAGDAVEQDNVQEHRLRVVKTRIKVLYVEYQPTYDWRFLSSHLTREPRHDENDLSKRNRYAVQVILQSADRKFENPHSRDLKKLDQFPRTRKELFEYDVIILGDIDWRRLHKLGEAESRKLLQLVVDFVEAGGGLALQAGAMYRNPLRFLDTPLAQLLPIAAHSDDEETSDAADLKTPFNIRLTDAGIVHPIFAIVPGTADEPIPSPALIQKTWMGEMPISENWYWYWLYRAKGGVRPGAVPLATVKAAPGDRRLIDDRGQPLTVFATMNFGKGRVFWSSLDYISRLRREHGDEFYGGFWEQVIRYLATYRLLGGNKRYKIFTDKDEYFVSEQAEVTITALDEDFEPLDEEFLDGVRVEQPDGQTIERIGENRPQSLKQEGQPGHYRFFLPLKSEGAYRVWIEHKSAAVTARGGRERAEKRIAVTFRARERIEKIPDLETLERIAKETNPGTHDLGALRLYELEDHVGQMQDRRRERILEREDRSQWDKWWVLLLIVGLLGLEWALRKRWQMI
ncbi:MAG: hypothetical protein QNJ98_18160 [Planctomycetota bacterium]|nr:hypothetical protein [Planctomycetota bacterium]